MGSNYQSGLVQSNVIISSSTKLTAAVLTGEANNATVDMGTVGAGKVWRVLTMCLTANTSGTTDQRCKIILAGTDALIVRSGSAAAAPTNNTGSLNWSYSAAPVLTAGQKIQVYSQGASINAAASVSYVEETA